MSAALRPSLNSKTHEAGPDFRVQAGFASKHEQTVFDSK
jgi:hypothetical protein